MKKKNNKTIETEGKPYDAMSGLPVQSGSLTSLKIPISVKERAHVQRQPINSVARPTPKTSPILMRSSVKKPGFGFKRHLTISESTDSLIDATPIVVPSSHIDIAAQQSLRNQRAAAIKQSERISHFVAPPIQQATKPVSSGDQSWQPAPQTSPPEPPKSRTDLILERGLDQATAHEQKPLLKHGSKWRRTSLMSASVAAAVVVLFIGLHGFTKLQLRVASAKVGFSTSLPSYQPTGFGLGQLSYSSNIFASEFQSKSGAESYTITQETTPWTSQDLLDNYVIVNNLRDYQTVHVGDRTIYLYGTGDATWVSGGIWYQIDSDGSLNASQLIGVANSL